MCQSEERPAEGSLDHNIRVGIVVGGRSEQRATVGDQHRMTAGSLGRIVEPQAAMIAADLTDVMAVVDCCILEVARTWSRPYRRLSELWLVLAWSMEA